MVKIKKKIKEFGFWKSDLSPKIVADNTLRFSNLEVYKNTIFWTESRPINSSNVIVKRDISGIIKDVVFMPFNPLSRVHEYGGGEFGISDNILVFVNADDQDLYLINFLNKKKPIRLTNIYNMRFADIQIFDSNIIAVAEFHDINLRVPQNMLVRLSINSIAITKIEIISSGKDFYAYPRISPCGKKIAYMSWNFPYMQWQNSSILIADITLDGLKNEKIIAGGNNIATFSPLWGNNIPGAIADLYYISDETGFGNIYVYRNNKIINLLPIKAECGNPNWLFGMRSFDILSNGNIILRIIENGIYKLILINQLDNKIEIINTVFKNIDKVTAFGNQLLAIVTTDSDAEMLILFSLCKRKINILQKTNKNKLLNKDLSIGKIFKFIVKEKYVYAIYYPPINSKFIAKDNELPPVIIKIHGGPTSMAHRGFNIKYHYWTNRGFALVDLDYRGSFGYGRDYMKYLDGKWGISDVNDVVNVVKYLIKYKKINKNKVFISGNSAGGFTALMALASTNIFLGGTSYYGIIDLREMIKFTHKFEFKYIDSLIGLPEGLTSNEINNFILNRSPISKIINYQSPTLFLQGLNDKIVLPCQSKKMYKKLKNKKIITKLLSFKDEGHGFRKINNIIISLKEELNFYKNLL